MVSVPGSKLGGVSVSADVSLVSVPSARGVVVAASVPGSEVLAVDESAVVVLDLVPSAPGVVVCAWLIVVSVLLEPTEDVSEAPADVVSVAG